MHVESLAIADVLLITPNLIRDDRGVFCETYNRRALEDRGIASTFVQDNQSVSTDKGTIRGLHFQTNPHAQGKLVRVVRGSIFDVAVDIRIGSPTYGQHVSAILSAENWAQLWIPEGFAHGFCTLEAQTQVVYKVTNHYAPSAERGIHWADPALAIAWPVSCEEARLSDKDRRHPVLKELAPSFHYRGTQPAALHA